MSGRFAQARWNKFIPAPPCYRGNVINVNSKGKFSEIFICSQARDARERIELTEKEDGQMSRTQESGVQQHRLNRTLIPLMYF